MTRSIGTILLCIWLIVGGLLVITNLQVDSAAPLLAIIAIAAGVAMLFGK